MSDIKLYHYWDSTCSMKARMCLAEKRLEWESVHIDLGKLKHLDAEYMAINRYGVVPTLAHNGETIVQSNIICEYLEDWFPGDGQSLIPEDPLAKARMREWAYHESEYVLRDTATATFNLMIKQKVKMIGEDRIRAAADAHPNQARAQARLKALLSPLDTAAVAKARQSIEDVCERMENRLSQSNWLAGDRFSLADISYAPYVDRMEHLCWGDLWQDRHALSDWVGRIKSRPSYRSSIPPDDQRLPPPVKMA